MRTKLTELLNIEYPIIQGAMAWVYDEAVEGVKFEDQPADYVCPICGVGKDQFEKM